MTEWPIKNRKYWIGTRIDVFTEIIRQKYGLGIIQSKIVKVNLELKTGYNTWYRQ